MKVLEFLKRLEVKWDVIYHHFMKKKSMELWLGIIFSFLWLIGFVFLFLAKQICWLLGVAKILIIIFCKVFSFVFFTNMEKKKEKIKEWSQEDLIIRLCLLSIVEREKIFDQFLRLSISTFLFVLILGWNKVLSLAQMNMIFVFWIIFCACIYLLFFLRKMYLLGVLNLKKREEIHNVLIQAIVLIIIEHPKNYKGIVKILGPKNMEAIDEILMRVDKNANKALE